MDERNLTGLDIVNAMTGLFMGMAHALEQRDILTREDLAVQIESGLDAFEEGNARLIVELMVKGLRQKGDKPPPPSFTVIDGGKT